MEEQSEFRTRLRTIGVFSMLLAVFGAVGVFAYFATFSRPVTTVILVRHAEKNNEPDNPNPNLSPAGHERAQELARLLSNAGVTAIYASQYVRTQQTVQPTANQMRLPVVQIDARNTDELVQQISTKNRGGVVLIAGHNNTVPAAIAALGGGSYPVIPENEFDNMFIVTIYRFGKAKVVKLKYGKASASSGGTGTMIP